MRAWASGEDKKGREHMLKTEIPSATSGFSNARRVGRPLEADTCQAD